MQILSIISPTKKNVHSAIMGSNDRVVLWVKLPNVFRTDLAPFSLVKVYNSSHTFGLDLILVCNLLQYCGIRSVLIKYLQRLVFHYFLRFKGFRTDFPQILSQICKCYAVMTQFT